jgi:hypothetical protein
MKKRTALRRSDRYQQPLVSLLIVSSNGILKQRSIHHREQNKVAYKEQWSWPTATEQAEYSNRKRAAKSPVQHFQWSNHRPACSLRRKRRFNSSSLSSSKEHKIAGQIEMTWFCAWTKEALRGFLIATRPLPLRTAPTKEEEARSMWRIYSSLRVYAGTHSVR